VTQKHLDALRSSVDRLRAIATPIADADLTQPAYPTEWSIADVLSHLGSGAVITQGRLDDVLAGRATPDDFAPGVWSEWNAKSPAAQRHDALEADAALLAALEAVPVEDRERATFTMGPMTLGFSEFVGMRLNEHAFHTWDIEVVGDPVATLPPQVTDLVVDNLALIARFTARPQGGARTITVTTTAPDRAFIIKLRPDSATLQPAATSTDVDADVALPSETFARLVYGRLTPRDTAHEQSAEQLNTLRRVFPGP